jgi:predicted polyphosphate/ATP-dependent NAD kinase
MKMGFIINPIAGMGGKVALKGTNGVLKEAIARGAKPIALERAKEFLQKLREYSEGKEIEAFVCPGVMGAEAAKAADYPIYVILPMKIGKETSAEDTRKAVRMLIAANVDLIVFVGGDGTAKDILDAMQKSETPVLGVPSGVKMYSGIFAVNPSDAADVVLAFSRNQAEMEELEIMDADEEAIRNDTFSVKLYGFLKGPFLPARIQGSKQVSPETTAEKDNQIAIAKSIVEQMVPTATYILAPGTTVKRVSELLGIEKTILGVDIYKKGTVILDVGYIKVISDYREWRLLPVH